MTFNHHGAENFSDLIGRTECNEIVNFNMGKTNFEVHRNLSANNTLVAVFEICFKT